jgi:hypothetical protein
MMAKKFENTKMSIRKHLENESEKNPYFLSISALHDGYAYGTNHIICLKSIVHKGIRYEGHINVHPSEKSNRAALRKLRNIPQGSIITLIGTPGEYVQKSRDGKKIISYTLKNIKNIKIIKKGY